MTQGVVLAADVGKARIGIAACDSQHILAFPVETVQRHPERHALQRIAELTQEHNAQALVVGLPLNLHHRRTASTDDAIAFASKLADDPTVPPILFVDERLSTVEAHRSLIHSRRTGQRQRAVIDQAAAVVILEQYLSLQGSDSTRSLQSVRDEFVIDNQSGEDPTHGDS